MGDRIQVRRGTAAQWASAGNPILAAGEPGYETDNKIWRVGDGVTPFSSLQGLGPLNPALFATAGQGAKADTALQNQEPVTVTNWNSVHAGGSGPYVAAAGATNAPAGSAACTGHYFKRSATTGTLEVKDTTGRTWVSAFTGSAIGPWIDAPYRSAAGITNLDALTSGDFSGTFASTATGAPSGYGVYTGVVKGWGDGTRAVQIANVPGGTKALIRTYGFVPGTWDAWSTDIHSGNIAQFLNAFGSAPIFAVRAWVTLDMSTGTPVILASGNVSSVTDNGVGDYTINFAVAMPDMAFAVAGAASEGVAGTNTGWDVISRAPSAVRITVSVGTTEYDTNYVSLIVVR